MDFKSVFELPLLRSNFFLYFTFLLFPISERIGTIALLFATLYGLVGLFNKNERIIEPNSKIPLLLSFSFFLIVVVNAVVFNGFRDIEVVTKYLVFFISYLVLKQLRRPEMKFSDLLDWFVFGVVVLLIISFIRFAFAGEFPIHYADIEKYTSIHPVYFSAYLLVAINHLLYKKDISSFIKILSVTLLGVFIIIAQSRISYIALVLIIISYMVSNTTQRKRYLAIIATFILVLLFSLQHTVKTPLKAAINERMQIWDSSRSVISENLWFGVGFSNEQSKLNKQYFYEGKFNLLDRSLNSHNMYLSIVIQSGIIGGLFLISLFIFPLFNLNRDIKIEYVGFILIIATVCFTESIFIRNWSMILILISNYYSNLDGKDPIH
jgi:O-antigen ligase